MRSQQDHDEAHAGARHGWGTASQYCNTSLTLILPPALTLTVTVILLRPCDELTLLLNPNRNANTSTSPNPDVAMPQHRKVGWCATL